MRQPLGARRACDDPTGRNLRVLRSRRRWQQQQQQQLTESSTGWLLRLRSSGLSPPPVSTLLLKRGSFCGHGWTARQTQLCGLSVNLATTSDMSLVSSTGCDDVVVSEMRRLIVTSGPPKRSLRTNREFRRPLANSSVETPVQRDPPGSASVCTPSFPLSLFPSLSLSLSPPLSL